MSVRGSLSLYRPQRHFNKISFILFLVQLFTAEKMFFMYLMMPPFCWGGEKHWDGDVKAQKCDGHA